MMQDPWADEDSGPKPFAVGYRKGSGEGLVYGGLFIAAIGAMAFLAGSGAGFLVVTAAGLVATFHFYPLVEAGRPQLGANDDGLFIEGIGFIDWAEIAELELFRTSVRSIMMTNLIVTLARPLGDAVIKREKQEWWRVLTTRCYKPTAPQQLLIPLHPLQGEPDEIFKRLRAYRPARHH
jgi:hypothetical protein